MNVLLVVDRYIPEARSAAHLFEDLAKGLAARGHRVEVLTKYPTENLPADPPPWRETRDGVAIHRLPPVGEPTDFFWKAWHQGSFAARVCWQLTFRKRPDVVLVYSPPLLLAGACALATSVTRAGFAVNLHDLYPNTVIELGELRGRWKIAAARALERFVYDRARAIVVPNPEEIDYLRGRIKPATDARLVYNWITTDNGDGDSAGARRFRASHGLDGKFVVTYGGVIGRAQDLSAVVEAARMSDAESGVVFVIMGEGSRLAKWKADGAGVANLRFVAALPRDQYLDALRSSDIGIIALSADLASPAVPGKLQSIMAVGRPVVAAVPEGSAAARVVREAGCGIVTPPGDGRAFLDAVVRLRNDPGWSASLGAAGRDFARRHFSITSAVAAFEDALQRCVTGH